MNNNSTNPEVAEAHAGQLVLIDAEAVRNFRNSTRVPRFKRMCDAALAKPSTPTDQNVDEWISYGARVAVEKLRRDGDEHGVFHAISGELRRLAWMLRNTVRERHDFFAFWIDTKKQLDAALAGNGLQPIRTAPRGGAFILLAGPSGYTSTPLRFTEGRWSKDRNAWVNRANDRIADSGEEPTHWAPLPSAQASRELDAEITRQWESGELGCSLEHAVVVSEEIVGKPTPKEMAQAELNASIIEEASRVLQSVGTSGVALPKNWRWPLVDELGGIAGMMKGQPEADPLTIAYIAIGASEAWNEHRDLRQNLHCCQDEMVQGLVGHAAMLDGLFDPKQGLSGSFYYEVAKPFGYQMAVAEMKHEPLDAEALGQELITAIG